MVGCRAPLLSPCQWILVRWRNGGAGLLIFFLLVLGFLKPKEEEEERIWNDVGILSFSSFMEAQCQPGRGFKLRAKWLPAWLSKQHPVLPLPQLAVNTNPVVSAEDREPPASTPDKKSAFLGYGRVAISGFLCFSSSYSYV